jgi:hypothetical protein
MPMRLRASQRAAPDPRSISDFLDGEYLRDIADLQGEFATLHGASPDALYDWIRKRPYLSRNDLARIGRGCLKTVERWSRATGLPPARRRRPPGWAHPRPVLVVPAGADAGDWAAGAYTAGHSIRQVAAALRRSYTATRRLLLRRGVVFRPAREAVRSRHACCSRAWLVLHYTVQGLSLSLTRSARLASVSAATMSDWLLRFGIRIRSAGEQLRIEHAAMQKEGGIEDFSNSHSDCTTDAAC